ncbi:hypothetical protein CMQ_3644 [Grosmannia clavigera kw1407]|uniref:Zn(2)-C6 fungal-type domain-containing protein n=1 Tax=Grosmannia clavigera (strain kw1407 / UAMH 11150) TaxID=655863 RepID=F0XAG6_GROCL|nr:uncharacterized protein CMQ_3644 [Grosmannia clavigera kw1407]EFX05575.1 hypothetical protein CMQ_3644 [Grosmannia clavigera kw1407]
MATNVSPANSALGDFDSPPSDDESWAFMSTPIAGSLSDSSIVFLPSPASHSLASYGVVAHHGHSYRGPSPSLSNLSMSPGPFQMVLNSSPPPLTSAPSPVLLSAHSQRLPTSYSVQYTDFMPASMNATGLLTDNGLPMAPSDISTNASGFMPSPSTYLLDQQYTSLRPDPYSEALQASGLANDFSRLERENNQHQARLGAQGQQQVARLDIPFQMQSPANASPWNPMDVSEQHDSPMFTMDDYISPSPQGTFSSTSLASAQEAGMRSAANIMLESITGAYEQQQSQNQQIYQFQQFQIQQFLQQQRSPMRQHQQQKVQSQQATTAAHASTATKATPLAGSLTKSVSSKLAIGNLDKVKGTGSRVEKRKTGNNSSANEKFQPTTNAGTGNSVSNEDRFIIVTPTTISSHASSGSKQNLFDHLEAFNTTQKGRKGPLADEVKEGALQVRRLGACFCCHARKVRCDANRPCKNCTRLATSVPQVVCWRFDDFLVELFPAIIRSHFRKDEMAAYMSTHIADFTQPCTVLLSCGLGFKSTLEIRGARFFTAKSREILHHERLTLSGNRSHLKSFMAAPIALDLSETSCTSASSQQDRIKRTLRVYIENLIKEDTYVEQLTANLRQTGLPKKILTIVRKYYFQTNSPIVKQALAIYTMHYVMSHHISLTKETILDLAPSGMVPQNDIFVTPRMLNRQVKAVLDELMQEEVDKLFKMFTRDLKPKSRNSWAPCLAAFLVFCLFMEAVGLALDHFALAHNESDIQNERAMQPNFARSEAVKLGRAIENLPFRQFAHQFHYIYQTGATASGSSTTSTTTSTSGSSPSSSSSQASSFNGSITLLTRAGYELDFLGGDYNLDTIEPHPYPRDVTFDYTGRLCSTFLLSFTRPNKILQSS